MLAKCWINEGTNEWINEWGLEEVWMKNDSEIKPLINSMRTHVKNWLKTVHGWHHTYIDGMFIDVRYDDITNRIKPKKIEYAPLVIIMVKARQPLRMEARTLTLVSLSFMGPQIWNSNHPPWFAVKSKVTSIFCHHQSDWTWLRWCVHHIRLTFIQIIYNWGHSA